MILVPPPGSRAASDLGCCCPLVENNFGIEAPIRRDGWYLDGSCFVHCPPILDEWDFDYEDD